MRSKLRKLVKIIAEKADDTLNNENIEYYLDQLAVKGFDVEKYPYLTDTTVVVEEPKPVVAKPAKAEKKVDPVVTIPDPPKFKPILKRAEIPKPKVEEKKWISLEDLSYAELKEMGKKEDIKNAYRMKKVLLRKMLEEKINV